MINSNYLDVATSIFQERFADAACGFVAGSIVTGHATASSDIDLIVLYNDNTHEVYRDSLMYDGWPVEIFVQNLMAQSYFFREDKMRGACTTMNMISTDEIIGRDLALAVERQKMAHRLIAKGPKIWTKEEFDHARYAITDLWDDLRNPKDVDYIPAILAGLMPKLGDFYLRSQRLWSGSGKQLIKIMKRENAKYAEQFIQSFQEAQSHKFSLLERLIHETLAPHGGLLFEGYRSMAPMAWKTHEAI